ncbi:MAG: hypothetical protein KDD11_04155 [Acidobacteria bacterium]|nr:hypothetical protein [Acidobacteriota bacterium]
MRRFILGWRPNVARWAILLVLLTALTAGPALAHCDSLDGPVVTAARSALESGDLTPVLKWVLPEHESGVREAFSRSRSVRQQGPEARELADRWFFETVVRLHRAGEGFPYTGLQPQGAPIEPVILAADSALASGSGDELVHHLSDAVAEGIRERFRAALAAKEHSEDSVEAGRHYVAAYVELTHYVEALDSLVAGHGNVHGAETDDSHGHR